MGGSRICACRAAAFGAARWKVCSNITRASPSWRGTLMLTVAHRTCSHFRARPATHHTHFHRSMLLLADELSVAADATTHEDERGCEAAARDIELVGRRRAPAHKAGRVQLAARLLKHSKARRSLQAGGAHRASACWAREKGCRCTKWEQMTRLYGPRRLIVYGLHGPTACSQQYSENSRLTFPFSS